MTAHLSPTAPLVQTALRRIPETLGLHEALAGKHILITGGTGFFGKWVLALLYRLNMDGAGIRASVVSRNPPAFLAAHPKYRECGWASWLQCDVRELHLQQDRPIDLVLHAATETNAKAHRQPLEIFDTILDGTRAVLAYAARHGASRILLTGSGAQYGPIPDGQPVLEDTRLACNSSSTANAYGEAKRAQETMAAIHCMNSGMEPVFTRCFAFAGPGLPLNGHFAIGNFVRDAVFARAITLNSSGQAIRSYLHGADLAAWLLLLLAKGQAGQAYNVGSDEAISIARLAQRVAARIAPDTPVNLIGGGDGDSPRSYYMPDIGKARALGLGVWTSLDETIDEMAGFARQSTASGNTG